MDVQGYTVSVGQRIAAIAVLLAVFVVTLVVVVTVLNLYVAAFSAFSSWLYEVLDDWVRQVVPEHLLLPENLRK